jgi:hypothetical protein
MVILEYVRQVRRTENPEWIISLSNSMERSCRRNQGNITPQPKGILHDRDQRNVERLHSALERFDLNFGQEAEEPHVALVRVFDVNVPRHGKRWEGRTTNAVGAMAQPKVHIQPRVASPGVDDEGLGMSERTKCAARPVLLLKAIPANVIRKRFVPNRGLRQSQSARVVAIVYGRETYRIVVEFHVSSDSCLHLSANLLEGIGISHH